MKIMTILGTRPEIIRLSRIIPLLDRQAEHLLVHTGQNHDDRLSRIFFDELRLRAPDEHLDLQASAGAAQLARILVGAEALMLRHRPDRLLILGDTNSGLAALIARRLGLPVYHLEAGNRCHDDRVPEETNRRVIDHASTVLLPYTQRSRENLLREGFASQQILVTGNPIGQVLTHYDPQIRASQILPDLGLSAGQYFLVTCHRAESVDYAEPLRELITALARLAADYGYPVIFPCHPRTLDRLAAFGLLPLPATLRCLPPQGLFAFVQLMRHAACVLSDSGTVQEECCLLGLPSVTLREVTERPETVECGASRLVGTQPERICQGVAQAIGQRTRWTPPAEYLAPRVAETVANIVLGSRPATAAELAWQARPRP